MNLQDKKNTIPVNVMKNNFSPLSSLSSCPYIPSVFCVFPWACLSLGCFYQTSWDWGSLFSFSASSLPPLSWYKNLRYLYFRTPSYQQAFSLVLHICCVVRLFVCVTVPQNSKAQCSYLRIEQRRRLQNRPSKKNENIDLCRKITSYPLSECFAQYYKVVVMWLMLICRSCID